MADAMRELMDEHTVLSHFRADIFGLLTPFLTPKNLVDIVVQLNSRIRAHKIACRTLPAFGICIADSPMMSISLMRDYATMALNTIKGKFYATYAFFDEEMRHRMMLDKLIENDIADALEQHQICLYIQPKINMTNGCIIGGEALVRWNHPMRGLVAPAEFMPVLEKNGLVIDLDNPKTRSVLSHTLDMLHDLNFQIIAEGVEDVSQQDFLLSYDCSFLILLLCFHKLIYCQNNILNFIFHRSDSATKLFHFPAQRPHFCHLVFHGSTQLLTSCD